METALMIANLVFSLVGGVFMTAASILFLHCFYDPGFRWSNKKLWFYALFFIIDLIPYLFIDTMSLSVTFLFAIYEIVGQSWIAVHDYRGGKLKAAFKYNCVYFIIGLCTSFIIETASPYIFPNYDTLSYAVYGQYSLITNILCAIIFCGLYLYLYFRLYKQDIVLPWTKRERIFVTIYALATIGISIVIVISGKDSSASLMIMGIAFVLMSILVPVFFYYLRISEHFQERTKSQESYIQAELAHFQQYKQTQEETARFRHDTRNNLLCVNELLSAGKHREASDYVQSLLELTDTLRPKFVTGDEILDSILAVKSQVMEENSIAFQLDGVLAGGLKWKSVDVCNVFANALDNAIEACMAVAPEKRCITMKIKATSQYWFVGIENPVLEDVDTGRLFKKVGGYTSKKHGVHGIGTYNMRHTVEAYGGMIHARCADNMFALEIMIDKSSL